MLDKIALKLFDLLWPKIQDMLTEQLKKLAPVIAEKLIALLPVISASAAKAVVEQIGKQLPQLNIPGVPSVGELSKTIVDQIVKDPDIPILSDIFDVSEFLAGLAGKK